MTLKNITVQGNTVLPSDVLSEIYAPFLGQEILVEDLFKISGQITQCYQEQGYILSRAYIPVQEIEDGNVVIKVVEGYVSRVWFEWKEMDPDDRIKFYGYRIKKVKPLTKEYLERNLFLIQDLPGISMSAILKPSEDFLHASELIIRVSYKPIEISIDFNNGGTASVGRKRGLKTMTLNSILGLHDQLSVYGAADNSLKRQKIIGGKFTLPINTDGLSAIFKAETVRTQPQIE